MIIRHSERAEIQKVEEISTASLTKLGKEAAYDFGANLPCNRTYRIFHSSLGRTKDTAKEIQRGIQSRGAKAELLGILSFLTLSHSKREKVMEYIMRDMGDFPRYWFSNLYPPWEIERSLVLAQRTASGIVNNILNGEARGMDIYVSHDHNIMAYMFHWYGEFHPYGWVNFLDGFILQFNEESITVFQKDGIKEVKYPYWWNFKLAACSQP